MTSPWVLSLALFCAAYVQGDGHSQSCNDDQTACVAKLRQMLTDRDRFWFGSRFLTQCSSGVGTPPCINTDTTRLSVMSRLTGLRDVTDAAALTQRAQNISLAAVSFTAPKSSVYACGHMFDVPALTDHKVDPLHPTRVSSWSLNHVPRVTWTADTAQTMYTVVVWDVGYYYLHGLYINCIGGSMDTGVAIDTYSGPLNPFLRENVYIFAVYKQSSSLDVAAVQAQVGQIMVANMGTFSPSTFVAAFNALDDRIGIAAVNLMTVYGDPYSIQAQKDMRVLDNCPLLISQITALHTVTSVSNMTAVWSDNATTGSLEMDTPYLTSLSFALQVEYSTQDFSVLSCCVVYSLTRGMFRVDPFSTTAERPAMTRDPPKVHLSPINLMSRGGVAGDVYTLFMLDVAPALAPGADNPMLLTHWLVTNIRNADITTGDELAPYFGPNPFTPNAPRAYMFMLFKQPVSQLNNSVLDQFCPTGYLRCRLHPAPLIEAWGLDQIVGVTWFLAEQDAFARQRLYNVLLARTKEQACTGQPGYGDPCPSPCSGSSQILRSAAAFISLIVLTTMLYISTIAV